MSNRIPKVVKEGKIKVEGLEIRVCVLDDGQRIIHKEDFLKALEFLGWSEDVINLLLTQDRKEAENDF